VIGFFRKEMDEKIKTVDEKRGIIETKFKRKLMSNVET